MQPIARQFDLVSCPSIQCNPKVAPIVRMQAQRSFIENRLVAVRGDGAQCGAILIEGSFKTYVENRPVHLLGQRNSCAGSCLTATQRTFSGS